MCIDNGSSDSFVSEYETFFTLLCFDIQFQDTFRNRLICKEKLCFFNVSAMSHQQIFDFLKNTDVTLSNQCCKIYKCVHPFYVSCCPICDDRNESLSDDYPRTRLVLEPTTRHWWFRSRSSCRFLIGHPRDSRLHCRCSYYSWARSKKVIMETLPTRRQQQGSLLCVVLNWSKVKLLKVLF